MEHETIRAEMIATLRRYEEAGVDAQTIFHAAAQAFGWSLSRYVEPSAAVAFMQQETRRVTQAVNRASTSETVQ